LLCSDCAVVYRSDKDYKLLDKGMSSLSIAKRRPNGRTRTRRALRRHYASLPEALRGLRPCSKEDLARTDLFRETIHDDDTDDELKDHFAWAASHGHVDVTRVDEENLSWDQLEAQVEYEAKHPSVTVRETFVTKHRVAADAARWERLLADSTELVEAHSNQESKDQVCQCRFMDIVHVRWLHGTSMADAKALTAHVVSIDLMDSQWNPPCPESSGESSGFGLVCVSRYHWNLFGDEDVVMEAIRAHKVCLQAWRSVKNDQHGHHTCPPGAPGRISCG
jgi:hypothetical protein